MKKILYYLGIGAMLINSSACNDVLDQIPNNSISGSTMWTSESQADQGIIGVYYSLQKPISGHQIVGVSAGVPIGYYGFEALGMTGQGSYAANGLFNSGVNPSNIRFSFAWQWCYDGVHRANEAITYIPNINMDEAKKSRLVAEAKVLRAFFYSRLNELFGGNGLGVPVYLEPVAPQDLTKAQSSEAEVWAQIIQDLTDAINEPNLPDNGIGGEGRMSKGAAYAYRGRAYLITGQYANAVADFEKVGTCGYSLYPDYKALFKVAQERCEEMIFSIQYIEDPAGYGSQVQKFAGAFQAGSRDSRGCWTDLQITPALVDLYEVITDNNTVKPFEWTDYIPEWNSLSTDDRKVFFLRDTLINGTNVHSTISNVVKTQIDGLSATAKALYHPEGNEARLTTAYNNRDPRLNYNVIVPYSKFRGVNINSTSEADYISRWPVVGKYYVDEANAENNLREGMLPSLSANAQAKFYYMHRKFIGEGLEYARRENNPVDEPLMRYADVLLMWAEALVEQNDLSGAMAKVKQVRDRAGVPTMASSFSSQEIARNYVRDERRRELIGEGVNFFDEMRWRTIKETKFDTQFPQMVWGSTSGGTTYQWVDRWYVWPVPKEEVEINKNLTHTPGWTY